MLMTIAENMRVSALDWWNSLDYGSKQQYALQFFSGRSPELLTGREVEQLYRHENYFD